MQTSLWIHLWPGIPCAPLPQIKLPSPFPSGGVTNGHSSDEPYKCLVGKQAIHIQPEWVIPDLGICSMSTSPSASLRPRFNIMNSPAAHGNAGSHYVIGQYKRGRSEYNFFHLWFRILSAWRWRCWLPSMTVSFPSGHQGWIAGGCYIPLALPPSQSNLALRLHSAEGELLTDRSSFSPLCLEPPPPLAS